MGRSRPFEKIFSIFFGSRDGGQCPPTPAVRTDFPLRGSGGQKIPGKSGARKIFGKFPFPPHRRDASAAPPPMNKEQTWKTAWFPKWKGRTKGARGSGRKAFPKKNTPRPGVHGGLHLARAASSVSRIASTGSAPKERRRRSGAMPAERSRARPEAVETRS